MKQVRDLVVREFSIFASMKNIKLSDYSDRIAKRLRFEFENGLVLSVIQGPRQYSGSDTFEVAVWDTKGNYITHRFFEHSEYEGVCGWQTINQIKQAMVKIESA